MEGRFDLRPDVKYPHLGAIRNELAEISERRSIVSKKIYYLSIIVSVVLGLAILLFFPLGIVSIAIVVLCFGLALFLVFRTKGGDKNVTRT